LCPAALSFRTSYNGKPQARLNLLDTSDPQGCRMLGEKEETRPFRITPLSLVQPMPVCTYNSPSGDTTPTYYAAQTHRKRN